jgi:hypothetical protein
MAVFSRYTHLCCGGRCGNHDKIKVTEKLASAPTLLVVRLLRVNLELL